MHIYHVNPPYPEYDQSHVKVHNQDTNVHVLAAAFNESLRAL